MANLNQRQHRYMNGQGADANIPDGQAQGNLLFEVGPPNHVAHRRPRFIGENGVQRPRFTSAQKEHGLRLLDQGFSYRQVAQGTSQNCSNSTRYHWKRVAAKAKRQDRRRKIVNFGHFLLYLLKLVGKLAVGSLFCYVVFNYPKEFFGFILISINVILLIALWPMILANMQ